VVWIQKDGRRSSPSCDKDGRERGERRPTATGNTDIGDITPDQLIAQIAEWRGHEVRYETLAGAITNHNYLVTVDGEPGSPGAGKFVLRIPGKGTDTFIDRECEQHNQLAAAAAGVSPPVLYLIEPGYCRVVPFIEGETLHPATIAGHPDRLRLVVEAIRTYHDKAVFENEVRVFDLIRDYARKGRELDAPQPYQIEWMLWVGQRIERALQRDEPAAVACHGNLLSENFLLGPEGRLWVIDWEHSGTADPYFDLGSLCVEHPLSASEEESVLATYCGSPEERRYARMMLYKLIVDLRWSLWAMIQCKVSKLEFDFYQYGLDRIARFCDNAAHSDLETWLKQA
jgi:thiamine kinase-like enzyme